MDNYNNIDWLRYAVTHINEGFQDMRWKKAGSIKTAWSIIVLFFLSGIFQERLSGFQFQSSYDKTFNIIPYIMGSAGLFLAWVTGNNAVSTFLDGEGTFRNIFIYSAYSLVPYIAQRFINTFLSHFLIEDEFIFMEAIEITGTVWTILLVFSAVRAVHQYSFSRTFISIILTIAAMFIMLFLLILFMCLIQQIFLFISSLYAEISYRIRV